MTHSLLLKMVIEIVCFTIQTGDFHSYVCLPEDIFNVFPAVIDKIPNLFTSNPVTPKSGHCTAHAAAGELLSRVYSIRFDFIAASPWLICFPNSLEECKSPYSRFQLVKIWDPPVSSNVSCGNICPSNSSVDFPDVDLHYLYRACSIARFDATGGKFTVNNHHQSPENPWIFRFHFAQLQELSQPQNVLLSSTISVGQVAIFHGQKLIMLHVSYIFPCFPNSKPFTMEIPEIPMNCPIFQPVQGPSLSLRN